MATGLEVLGAVAASLELVKVATVCLSAINNVRHIGLQVREQKDAHLNLLIQGLKFERWCSALGIQEIIGTMEARPNIKDWEHAKAFSEFKDAIGKELRLENPEFAQLTLSALEGMRDRFVEATNIISRYATTSDGQMNTPQKQGKLSSTWNRLVRKGGDSSSSPEGHNGTKSRTGATLTMRWMTSDKSALLERLSSIEKTNNLLLDLLDSALRTQIDRRTEMTILETVDEATLIGADSLPDDSSLRNMAKIKQWQLRETREKNNGDAVSSYSVTTNPDESFRGRVNLYQPKDFKTGTLPHGEYRSLSSLDGEKVMVEWKYHNREQPVRMEQTLRLGGLVGLLNRSNLFQRFLTLPCRGLVNDTANSRIGIIFSADGSTTREMTSLQDVIRKAMTPVVLARKLVTALHHLHSVQWLHKSIRSDNIICFTSKAERQAVPETPPADNGETSEMGGAPGTNAVPRKPPPPLPTFHLVGWDLSRPDHPSELSETLSISTIGFQSKRDTIQLYSHPETHGVFERKRKTRYRPEFDIYSLGLVLLEIGLWRTIDTIRSRCQNDSDFRTKVQAEYCDKLLPKMGEVYWRVVQRCLTNDFEMTTDGGPNNEHFSLQVSLERDVVCELEKCYA